MEEDSESEKILIITDDAGESFEILFAQHRFAEAGFTPVIAATCKKALHGVIHDFDPGWNTYVERPGYRIESDIAIGDADPVDYAGILLIGGRAPEFLRHDGAVLSFVKAFEETGRWIFAICHGTQILVTADLIRDRDVTCYCNVRSEATSAGARWHDRQCVRDGNLITAQTWESHPDFYRTVFEAISA